MQQPSQKKETPPISSEINEQVSPLLKKLTENLKQIGLVFGAIILVAAVVTGYKYYRITTLENAQARMGEIMLQDDPLKRIKDLEAFLPDSPKKLKPAIRLQIASQAMEHGEYELAAEYWERISSTQQDEELAVIASIGRANALHLQGETGQAMDILSGLQREAPEAFSQNINYALASVAEASQDWETSLKAYEQLKSASGLTGSNTEYLEHKITQLQEKIRQGKSS